VTFTTFTVVSVRNTDIEWVGNEVSMFRDNLHLPSSGFHQNTQRQISEGTHIQK